MKAPAASPLADLRDTVRTDGLEVDRAPVTNQRYARFVEATGHRPPLYWERGAMPAALADHPVVGIDLFDGFAFAAWAGGRLPTELEWVQACGLGEHQPYVWGDRFRSDACNTIRDGRKSTSPVGAYPLGTAPSGCVDLCGNVWELTCSAHSESPDTVLVKGGSWYDFPCHTRIDTSFRARPDHCGATIGFRLVYGGERRLPAFLDEERLTQSIAERRGPRPWREPTPEDRSIDPDLALPAGAQVRHVLALLDQTVIEASPVAPRAPVRRQSRANRMARFLPAAAVFSVTGLALIVVQALLDDASGVRGERPVPETIPVTAARPRRTTRPVSVTPLEQAIADLRSRDAEVRTKAETHLIERPEAARIALGRLVRRTLSPRARASIRYVESTWAETEGGSAVAPLTVKSAPMQGLVHLVQDWTAETADHFATIRRTGAAEGLPVTLVYTGEEPVDRLLSHHSYEMGPVVFFHDEKDTLARRWGIRHKPATAGLDRNGRLAFLHVGPLTRASLAERAGRLRGQ